MLSQAWFARTCSIGAHHQQTGSIRNRRNKQIFILNRKKNSYILRTHFTQRIRVHTNTHTYNAKRTGCADSAPSAEAIRPRKSERTTHSFRRGCVISIFFYTRTYGCALFERPNFTNAKALRYSKLCHLDKRNESVWSRYIGERQGHAWTGGGEEGWGSEAICWRKKCLLIGITCIGIVPPDFRYRFRLIRNAE